MRSIYKVVGFVGTVLAIILAVGCIIGAVAMYETGIYGTPEEVYRNDTYGNLISDRTYNWMWNLKNGEEVDVLSELEQSNISEVKVYKKGEEDNILWNYQGKDLSQSRSYKQELYYGVYKSTDREVLFFFQNEDAIHMQNSKALREGTIIIEVDLVEGFSKYDAFYFANRWISLAYEMQYKVFVIGIGAVILAILGFVFLLYAAGRRYGAKQVFPGWGTKIPFDVLTLALVVTGVLLVRFVIDYCAYGALQVVLAAAGILGYLVMILGWFMSLAVRIKLKILWKNTVVHYCAHWILVGVKKLGRLFCKIPMVWRTTLIFCGVSLAEFIIILCNLWEGDNLLVWWCVEKFFFFPAILYIAVGLRKLKKGGECLAEGDLHAKIDTGGLIWDLREHGDNLNQIRRGMAVAVEKQMKSERMKTELITNVSHDIKTPLTSIISYVDLLEKEPESSEKVREYTQVISRQSQRLKRLIEDLVEASKAATGNLEVNLVPCDVGVLVNQSIGEYDKRMRDAGLALIATQPTIPIMVEADGRRMWRVFDNLLGNVCKYAQEGTRVYLNVEKISDQVIISLKNTSRDPLNISAEELMERFVQGDNSRNAEGNGLGLSIAKSLVELQKGSFEVTVDGDLFKVVLRFPYCKTEGEKLK